MTQADLSIAPVRKSAFVAAPPARAFEIFTARMGRWWPRSHAIGAAPLADVIIEPRVGGRWLERGEDGADQPWGEVRVWAPPTRLVLVWRLDSAWRYDPTLDTEVEITFTAEGAGTRVDLEHRMLERYGATVDAARAAFDSPNGWGGLLDRYAAIVQAD